MESITFLDDRTFTIGQRVAFHTRHDSTGHGTVSGFGVNRGCATVKIDAESNTEWGMYDRWPLRSGGHYNRLSSVGIYGGEIL